MKLDSILIRTPETQAGHSRVEELRFENLQNFVKACGSASLREAQGA